MRTALHSAASNRDREGVKRLLEFGADATLLGEERKARPPIGPKHRAWSRTTRRATVSPRFQWILSEQSGRFAGKLDFA